MEQVLSPKGKYESEFWTVGVFHLGDKNLIQFVIS